MKIRKQSNIELNEQRGKSCLLRSLLQPSKRSFPPSDNPSPASAPASLGISLKHSFYAENRCLGEPVKVVDFCCFLLPQSCLGGTTTTETGPDLDFAKIEERLLGLETYVLESAEAASEMEEARLGGGEKGEKVESRREMEAIEGEGFGRGHFTPSPDGSARRRRRTTANSAPRWSIRSNYKANRSRSKLQGYSSACWRTKRSRPNRFKFYSI